MVRNIPQSQRGLPAWRRLPRVPRSWTVNTEFRKTNYFSQHVKEGKKEWRSRYGSFTPNHIKQIFHLIEPYFIHPRASKLLKLNKLLLWFNVLHEQYSTWGQIRRIWGKLSTSSIRGYMLDVDFAFIRAFYKTEDIIGIPSEDIIERLENHLKQSGQKLYKSPFALDGKCTQVVGRLGEHQKFCWKFKKRPAENHLYFTDRVLSLARVVSIGNKGRRHDNRILTEHPIYPQLGEFLKRGPALADSGYAKYLDEYHSQVIAAVPSKKKHTQMYYSYPESLWKIHRAERSSIEHWFGCMFVNQFPALNYWKKKGNNALKRLNLHIFCATIAWNLYQLMKHVRITNYIN